MALTDKLREEIIATQQAQASLVKWKLVLVSAIATASLGLLPGHKMTIGSLALLAAIPLVCLYVDALCFHTGVRVITIAKYFRVAASAAAVRADDSAAEFINIGTYERYCRHHRNHFGLENIALLAISVGLSLLVVIAGVALWLEVPWLLAESATQTPVPIVLRMLVALSLCAGGSLGVLACIGLYWRHRRQVGQLDDPRREKNAARRMRSYIQRVSPPSAAAPITHNPAA